MKKRLESKVALDACYAALYDDVLVVGNSHFERRWRVTIERLHPISILHKSSNSEWINNDSNIPVTETHRIESDKDVQLSLSVRCGLISVLQEESLIAELTVQTTNRVVRYHLQVFPKAAGAFIRVSCEASEAENISDAENSGEPNVTGIETSAPSRDAVVNAFEYFKPQAQHLKLTQATLRDQTDMHSELVAESEYLLLPNERWLKLSGNVFAVENTLTKCGIIFVLFAPLPHARPVRNEYDCYWNDRMLAFYSSNESTHVDGSYPWALLCYQNGREGRIAELQKFQRQLRRYDFERDGVFLSNTWGDRSRDARIEHEFIEREINAAAQLGVEVIQIDDGWQTGKTANSAQAEPDSAWSDFWKTNPHFWEPNPHRFPHGLKPLVENAKGRGIRFGLWFAPDSADDFANWKRDADHLLHLHRTFGIEYFKLDAIKQTSKKGEANLQLFFDRVLNESQGAIVLDLDVTAEVRPGYFGRPDCGPIFIENRYTDWRSYWPHSTLRAAWQLAHWIDPLRLRIEFLNNTRNAELYGDDALAPSQYTPEYLFAITMFFNPLGWFEVQNLPPDHFQGLAELVKIWKQHRSEIHDGTIIPIGQAPTGASWTGFCSLSADDQSAYLLMFREWIDEAEYSLHFPYRNSMPRKITLLSGEGSVSKKSSSENSLQICLPQPLSFALARLEY